MSESHELAALLRTRLQAHGQRSAVSTATSEVAYGDLLARAADIGDLLANVSGNRHAAVIIVGRPGLAVYAATLGAWFGVADNDLHAIFPNLRNFARPNLGFL